ncbi:MAG: PPC domain-containing protein [Myxococcaceae bacterium]
MGSILKISRVRLPDVLPLANGESVTGLQLEAGYWRYYRFHVPVGQNVLVVSASGSSGELDLFVRHGALPARHGYDFQMGTGPGNRGVRITVESPSAGDWYIGLFSWNYEGVSLTANHLCELESPALFAPVAETRELKALS